MLKILLEQPDRQNGKQYALQNVTQPAFPVVSMHFQIQISVNLTPVTGISQFRKYLAFMQTERGVYTNFLFTFIRWCYSN